MKGIQEFFVLFLQLCKLEIFQNKNIRFVIQTGKIFKVLFMLDMLS